mgnify:CR=1 FL=1|jgi:hypothetical protein
MGIGNANYVYWTEAANVGAPFTLTPPVISGTPSVGNTLATTNGSGSSDPFPNFSYQWMKDATVIPGATSGTLALITEDIGGIITCVVSATNAAGRINTTSNSLGPIIA